MSSTSIRTTLLTILAMLAFAGNSVLCRLALKEDAIDPTGYTLLRILSGAAFLAAFLLLKTPQRARPILSIGNWPAAFALFIYAATLSFGYINIDTGTGALVLFGFVQVSMIMIGVVRGSHLGIAEWAGVSLAFGGLCYLLMPGGDAPDIGGFVLMAISGIAWGVYTIIGRGSANPLEDTAGNFIKACVPALLLTAALYPKLSMTAQGIVLAVVSGALTSGAGYAIWYAVAGKLRVAQAAVVQLSVPVIAALGGVAFAAEPITLRFTLASVLVLSGILLVTLRRNS
jgi:drug/metabolite transporter (DMT)-like permease